MLQFVTKIFHDTKTPRTITGAPVASATIPRSVLRRCSSLPRVAHTGERALIYKARVKDKTLGMKVVPESDKKSLRNMLTGMKLVGTIGSWVNPSVSESFKYLRTAMEKEVDVGRELKWCSAVNKTVKPKQFGVRTIVPEPQLCTDTCFVYRYEDAPRLRDVVGTIDQARANDIGRRLTMMFFQSLHTRHAVLLGDMDIDNFLYDPEKDEIVLLDFGRMSRLHRATQARMKEFHASMASYADLKATMSRWGASESLVRFVYATVRPFFSKRTRSFKDAPSIDTALKDFNVQACQIPPDIMMSIRACNQLIDTLRLLDARFDARQDILRTIAIDPVRE